jgi:very-short-patch-repair endonuclease
MLLGEIDLPFPAVRYGAEIDGPHHLLPSVIAADKARDRRLRRQADWIVDRFPADEVRRHPREFVRQILAGLDAASRRPVEPWRSTDGCDG